MKIFPDKFPFNVPYLLAGFIGGFGAIFGLTALIAEGYIGRPSSTQAIGFIFVPIYAAILALVCFGVGLVARGIIGRFVIPRSFLQRTNRTINVLFVCVLVSAFFLGVVFVEKQEEKQKPHVILDSGRVIKMAPSEIKGKKEGDATFVFSIYSDEKNTTSFQWNGKRLDFKVIGDNILKLSDREGKELITADLKKYD